MLSNEEIQIWYAQNNVSDDGCKRIASIRGSDPAYTTGRKAVGVKVAYPSRKMGHSIHVDAHKLRYAAALEYEYDDDVIEYWDLPPAIKLTYKHQNGSNGGMLFVPHFFVIRRASAGYEEWQNKNTITKYADRAPNRYVQNENGLWHCPPGEREVQGLGLYYTVRTSAEISWPMVNNIEYLTDYLGTSTPNVPSNIQSLVLSTVSAEPGISRKRLEDLLKNNVTSDHVLNMIAHSMVYADLNRELVSATDEVHLYIDRTTAIAYELGQNIVEPLDFSTAIVLESGQRFEWDGRLLEILNVGRTEITCIDEDQRPISIVRSLLETLVKRCKVKGIPKSRDAELRTHARDRISKQSSNRLREANGRWDMLKRIENGESVDLSPRTKRDWKRKATKAQDQYGNSYVGLIDNLDNSGNRVPRYDAETVKIIQDIGVTSFGTATGKSKTVVYGEVVLALNAAGKTVPSRKTVMRIMKTKTKHEITQNREGARAAYTTEPIYVEDSMTTPKHGQYFLHVVHIDHTELDIELIDSQTGRNLGRPWVSSAIDAHTNSIVASVLSFDPPSTITLMRVARDLVQRNQRFPQILVVDGGKEFHSTYLDALLAYYHVTVKTRPATKARFGSLIENFMGIINKKFIHNISGNTKLTKNVRQLTPSVDPRNLTNKTFAWLQYYLEQFCFDVYDTIPQPGLGGLSPREARLQDIEQHGNRVHQLIPFDDHFIEQTRPEVPGKTRKVQPGIGVKIDYINYYSPLMNDPQIEGSLAEIRTDPDDAGVVFARIGGKWVMCRSEHYAAFSGKSRQFISKATEELKARRKSHKDMSSLSAAKIAEFILEAEKSAELEAQARHDFEYRIATGSNYLDRLSNGFVSNSTAHPILNIPLDPQPQESAQDSEHEDDNFIPTGYVNEPYGEF